MQISWGVISRVMVGWLGLLMALPSHGENLTNRAYAEWDFSSNANPAEASAASNMVGYVGAAVSVGFGSEGWLESLSGMGSQRGLWDLGFQDPSQASVDTRGIVALTVSNGISVAGSGWCDLGVQLVQFIDGFIYKGDLTFSLAGGSLASRTVIENVGGFGAKWVRDEYKWHLSPRPGLGSLSVTGSVDGTILSLIRLNVENVVVTWPTIVITSAEKSGDELLLSWTGGLPPYTILVNTNLADNNWMAYGTPVAGTNARVTASGAAGFVRVKGSQ